MKAELRSKGGGHDDSRTIEEQRDEERAEERVKDKGMRLEQYG